MGKARGNNESFTKDTLNNIARLDGRINKIDKSDGYLNQTDTQIHTDLHNHLNLRTGGIHGAGSGYNAAKVKITNGTILVGPTSGKQAGLIIVESESGVTDDLKIISYGYHTYLKLILIAKEGHTITLVSGEAFGFDLESSIIVTDKKFIHVRYDSLTNLWKLDGIGDQIILSTSVPTDKSQADIAFGTKIGTIGISDNGSILRMVVKQFNGNWAKLDFDYDALTPP